MKHPKKWRDTANPYDLQIENFNITNILGYPHAGNDVFQVEATFFDKKCRAFIKLERQNGADITNEVEIINKLDYTLKPKILAYSCDFPVYIVTQEVIGERLSTILNENPNFQSISCMEKYGTELAKLHSMHIECQNVKHRRFFDLPPQEYFAENSLQFAKDFLDKNKPKLDNKCFVHGDFHYANVLWVGQNISVILDYELSGIGVREFDIAWSVFLRPSQKFLKTYEEIKLFLSGYEKYQSYSFSAFLYYYVLIACHFYTFDDDKEYKNDVRRLIIESIDLLNS